MNSICHLSLQGHVIKAFFDFMVWSPSTYGTPHTKFGGHRHCGGGDVTSLIFLVISQDHVME